MDIPHAEGQGIGSGSIIRRKGDGSHECVTDEVAIEEPLEIRIGSQAIAVTMRTPGNDEELAAGFLLSEGIVRVRTDLRSIAPCTLPASLGNVINIELAPTVKFTPAATQRFGTISTSCGLCGKTSDRIYSGNNCRRSIPQRECRLMKGRSWNCRSVCVTIREILPAPVAFTLREYLIWTAI